MAKSLDQIETLRGIADGLTAVANRSKASGKRRSDNPLKMVTQEIIRFAKALETYHEELGPETVVMLVEAYLVDLTQKRGYMERFLVDRREYLSAEMEAIEQLMELSGDYNKSR